MKLRRHAPRVRVGDTVRVRSEEQVLATLDERGRLDGLPFQPEMLKFCGREMRIYRSAHKTCDTVEKTGDTRGMDSAWHLEDARCDGSAHDGCQMRCMHFWKEEWLETLDGTPLAEPQTRRPAATVVDQALLTAETRRPESTPDEPRYRCAATEYLNATRPVSVLSPSLYIADVRSGNAPLRKVLRVVAFTVFNKFQTLSNRLPAKLRFRGGQPYPFLQGTNVGKSVPPANLNLQVGEQVRVRRRDEIAPTLNSDLTNRGLWFDPEMLEHCGKQGKVLGRIERIIDEGSGKMIALRDCIIVDGIVCDGWLHRLCPRSDYNYWREIWLERVEQPSA